MLAQQDHRDRQIQAWQILAESGPWPAGASWEQVFDLLTP
jgi:hypothetical protein